VKGATNPTLSLAERDRRWEKTRALMKERGLAALVVPGLRARESFETWLSGESIQGAIVFPAEGEPIYLTWIAFRIVGRDDPGKDREYWIRDIRAGLIGPGIVSALKEVGAENETVGVIGLQSRGPLELEGFVPYRVWQTVLDGLPSTRFEEVSIPFSYMMSQKGEEELLLARASAAAGEAACEALLEAAGPGVSEAELYAAATGAVYRSGAMLAPPSLIVESGRDCLTWGPPEWGAGAVNPRTIEPGELISTEVMPSYGGVETQQQMMIAIGPVDPVWRELESVARRSYEAGLDALEPGATFFDVCDAMAAPLRDADCWHLSPLIHSVSPAYLLGTLHGGAERYFAEQYPWFRTMPAQTDAVLAEGMLFAFEPNACRGRTRVNIGGTVVVGASGPVELNSVPLRMHVVE
jgi:Xaa-Pro aminopeptidase